MSDFFDDFDDSDDTPVPDIDREASREALGVDSISGVAGTDFTDPSALDFDNPQAVHQQTVDRNWMIKAREDFAEQSLNTWRRVREEGDFSDAAIPEAFSRTVDETRNALLQDLPLDKDGEVLVSDDARRRLEDQLSTMASGYHDLGRQRHDTATKAKGLDLMARSAAMAAATATTAPFAIRGAMDNVRSDIEAYNGVFDKELIEHNVHAGQVQVLRGAIDGYVNQGMGDTARQLLTGDKFNDVLTDEDKTALQTHIDRTERRRDIEDEAAQNARRAEAETALLDGLTQGTLTSTDIDRIDGLPDDGPGSRQAFHGILERRDSGLVENGTDPTLHTDPDAYGEALTAALDGGITTADLIDRIGDGVSIEDATLLSELSKQVKETGPNGPTRALKTVTGQNSQGAGGSNLPAAFTPAPTGSLPEDTPNQFNRQSDETINDWAARINAASGDGTSEEDRETMRHAVDAEFQTPELRNQAREDLSDALKKEAAETGMSSAEFLRRQEMIRDALPTDPEKGVDVAMVGTAAVATGAAAAAGPPGWLLLIIGAGVVGGAAFLFSRKGSENDQGRVEQADPPPPVPGFPADQQPVETQKPPTVDLSDENANTEFPAGNRDPNDGTSTFPDQSDELPQITILDAVLFDRDVVERAINGNHEARGLATEYGTLSTEEKAFVDAQGVKRVNDSIMMVDNTIIHMLRDGKAEQQALPIEFVRGLRGQFDQPVATLGEKDGTILRIYDVPDDPKKAKIVIRINYKKDVRIDGVKVKDQISNFVISGGRIDVETLRDTETYTLIEGKL